MEDKIPANEDTGIYEDEEIANRVPKYIAILCVMFLILGILSIFITFPYTEEKEENGETVEETNNTKKESPENEARLIDLFFSSKNLKLLSFCFCGFCK